ncbi:hypothetical protein, partial [Pseudonocardia sp. GCM10023141]|uniref:hypothetical protein n=1 Tax=Pseudonocardia sp. GCM10023141 TaxID=3252653 RepID=UPI0036144A47
RGRPPVSRRPHGLITQVRQHPLRLNQADPKYGYVFGNGSDEVSWHNAELSGRQMCAVIIAGIDQDDAYGAAYPAVKAAGTITALDKQTGAVADQVLCPKP